MSGHSSPFLSWVTLLYLSSVSHQVSGFWRSALEQHERRGINASDQPYSQVALLSIKSRGTDFDSKQQDGPNGVSTVLDNQTVASIRAGKEKITSIRTAGKIAVGKTVSGMRVAIERAASARVTISKRAVSETVTSEKAASKADAGPLCAYRVLEDGKEGRLCFRHTQVNFTCPSGICRQVRSSGGYLVANMLSNGSVLLQWTYDGQGRSNIPGNTGVPSKAPEVTMTPTTGGDGETLPGPPKSPRRGQQKQQGGFRMSCWWNGSYTQFECASIILGRSCRDFLLTELHENVPYRICLQPLWAVWDGAKMEKLPAHKMKTTVEIWDGAGCVDFSVSPSGMQDIVIAMTTVGGAICVMLVIICLLVAYITENIMSPSVQHTLTARHSTRSHNTHL